MIYGSIPAGGLGTRLQPLGFAKELAPVGRRAVIEHLIERMLIGGIDRIFVNTSEDKCDLIRFLAAKSTYRNHVIFLVRERKGLLDGIVQPAAFLRPDDELCFGLPDTIWFPKDCFKPVAAHPGAMVLGLFDTGVPSKFDAVLTDVSGRIQEIQVKVPSPKAKWTWGIGKVRVSEVPALERLAQNQSAAVPLFGVAVGDYARTHAAYGIQFSDSRYLDIGSADDYGLAESFLRSNQLAPAQVVPADPTVAESATQKIVT